MEYVPCPFCGSRNVSASQGRTDRNEPFYYAECEACGACGPHTLDTLAEGVRLWNRRGEQQPCSTPSTSTAAPPPLSLGELVDLAVAFASGEMSEGFLREVTGLPGDTVRALWFDAARRANELAERFVSTRRPPGGATAAPPASSNDSASGSGSSGTTTTTGHAG